MGVQLGTKARKPVARRGLLTAAGALGIALATTAGSAAAASAGTVAAAAGSTGTVAAAAAAAIPADLAPSLHYKVHGEISAACTLSQTARAVRIVDLADPATDLARAATADLPFEIACNTPVRVALRSRHGGLRFEGAASSDDDFDALVPYRARLDLPRHSGALECDSSAMSTRAANCSDDLDHSILAGHGAVAVRVIPSGGGLLLAGRYSDQLTLSITPVLGSGER